jgi:hypothetical protein
MRRLWPFATPLALVSLGAAMVLAMCAALLRSDPCNALIWDQSEREFITQNLRPSQCFSAAEKLVVQGTLRLGGHVNSFTSEEGRVQNAFVTLTTEGLESALKVGFLYQESGGVRSYRVRIRGTRYVSDHGDELVATEILSRP